MAATDKKADDDVTAETSQGQGIKLKWDDAKMQTTYANAVNVTSTREEVSVFFGTNQTWNPAQDNGVVVQLSDRIVLNPYAAKRLSMMLSSVVKEYEKRFGALQVSR